ncbi:hypothetical protein H2199_003672 [Coniosporium tulheliwenetii]|uniref:Uncharacterized protein n=1 Tax=Coniosporium tulheliwenetii TaxID=3383036 RepID=A0ACC2ZAJ7_9PEZI|nr:hypothetical protein H2199_003672 [Cladosporium sp. JES 115]
MAEPDQQTLRNVQENNEDNSEKGGEDAGSPQSVGFWDHRLKEVRHTAFKKWILTNWGVFFHAEQNLSSFVVYIVDFDGQTPYDTTPIPPLVGPTISQLSNQMVSSGRPTLGFLNVPPSNFSNDPIQVRQAIYNWDAWVAVIINPNATAMLYPAITTGNTSYDPLGACQLVYQTGRDDTTYHSFILPIINMLTREATSMVEQMWAGMVLQNATDPVILAGMQAAPQAISPAIGFSEFNLRPLYPYTATAATTIGLIYLIIISFFSFSFYLPIHMQYLKPEGHPPLKFWQLIIWRWFATMTAYFVLSLAYSLISFAFQINFSSGYEVLETAVSGRVNPTAYGDGTFLVYWMINYFGMIALGLACENVAMVIGQPWMGLWLIFWVITNVSTAFYSIDIEPAFYR